MKISIDLDVAKQAVEALVLLAMDLQGNGFPTSAQRARERAEIIQKQIEIAQNKQIEANWPWCETCQSYHHPENQTCFKLIGNKSKLDRNKAQINVAFGDDVLMDLELMPMPSQIGGAPNKDALTASPDRRERERARLGHYPIW